MSNFEVIWGNLRGTRLGLPTNITPKKRSRSRKNGTIQRIKGT
jgi:hypothetical protein